MGKDHKHDEIHDHSDGMKDENAPDEHDHADHSEHDHDGHDHAGHIHGGHDHSEHLLSSHEQSGHDHAAMMSSDDMRADAQGANDEHAGHTDHSGHELMFRDKFWVSLFLSIPVLLYSETIQGWLSFSMPAFAGSLWITPLFSVIIFAFGGIPFLQMAVPEIRNRLPGMMTLISLAISVSFVYSLAALFFNLGEGFFWELVTLIDVMLLGHWIEMRSVRQASSALDELAKLMPDEAERILSKDESEIVSVSMLKMGDLVLVRPGASIPVDGHVQSGESQVNEAMITGESKTVSKGAGSQVIAGALNGEGSLRVEVAATGEKTALAGIMRLVKEAQQSKSRTQILADKAAAWLFYIAVATAVLTGIGWSLAEGFGLFALQRIVTVLVIACPHALGLAVPLVVAISTSSAAKNGVLVRDRLALEEAREIDIVVFDKTGTLTKGEQGVVSIETLKGWEEDQVLALAAAVEADSEHNLAKGILQAAKDRDLSLPKVSAFKAIKGHGVQAQWDGKDVYVGGPRMLDMLALNTSDLFGEFAKEAGQLAQTVIYEIVDEEIVAAFALADVIREESKETVDRLHEMGIQVAMLTGDSEEVAKAVATQLNIDKYFAEVLPENKDQKIVELQNEGLRVAMVGDGVNDAPALARADVGIAIGSGTDVALQSAGLILVNSNPMDVLKIFTLSKASYRKMIQNLIWAAGYNVVAIPLAAGVLAFAGIWLSPAIGALFMSASTVIVAINAQFLRSIKLSGSANRVMVGVN
jgi:Cu2+-exporting ATPase